MPVIINVQPHKGIISRVSIKVVPPQLHPIVLQHSLAFKVMSPPFGFLLDLYLQKPKESFD